MLVVQDPKDYQPPPAEYQSLNGVTPPTRDIRRRKWRKVPDPAQLRDIEAEVMRLLKPAENESIEILNAEEYLLYL
jgi:TATA-binding protein-associated factor Taf7